MALRETGTGGRIDDHGGSLGRARAMFPDAPEPWIDLSTGINPHSYPLFDLPATAFARLPEPGRLRDLLAVAARYYGAPSAETIVATPGTQILLPRVMALVAPGRARILGPTYAEHARTASLAGHDVEEVGNFAALADADVAVVVNPNNPDGRITARSDLLDLARIMARKGGLLVVDEAFMDVAPTSNSVADQAGKPGLAVLKSFGKFFGLAGVRLGFALTAPKVAARLEAQFGPWAVSGPALEYGSRGLADLSWRASMREKLARDAASLDALFASVGVSVGGGTSLFRFIDHPDAAILFEELGRAGILLRKFSWSRTALRCGIPRDESEWHRLERALSAWSGGRTGGSEKRA